MDDLIAQFTSITDTDPQKAQSYLRVSDGDLQQALQLFFETGGADMDAGPSAPTASSGPPPSLPPRQAAREPITIDDDADEIEDDDVREAMRASEQTVPAGPAAGSNPAADFEDDEAMARRLQEEFYTQSGNTGGAVGSDGVRAPIARTRETLLGPEEDDDMDYEEISQLMRRRVARGPAGIFNQQPTVWDERTEAAERERALAEATGGASAQSSKQNKLAELYRPPFEIISHLPFDSARDEAKELEKWILVNVQDQSIFDCQILNRDIWKAPEVMQTVKENFIFLQMDRTGKDGRDYVRLYLPQAADPAGSIAGSDFASNLFPHIAIIDPRTGEQVKVWSGPPKSALEFVHSLHEFLDRYSLKVDAKNPVQRKSQPKVQDVQNMSEEEMLEMALQNSLGNTDMSTSPQSHDPDELTKEEDLMDFEEDVGKGKGVAKEPTPFQRISSSKHHEEPPNGPQTTRIQFKMHDGSRAVRRFFLQDPVERLFEYVKADLLPEQEAKKGQEGNKDKEFDLVSLGKRLIEVLDQTVETAGLKMGTVMVETVED